MITIKVRQNGPYLVEGEEVRVVDWNGQPYDLPSRPFVLCRCGHSKRRPFCDATHRTVGFVATEEAAKS